MIKLHRKGDVNMSVITEPIYIIDRNSANKIINTIIINNYFKYKGNKDWIYNAKSDLEKYNINLKPTTLHSFLVEMKKGKRDCSMSSYFNNKVFTRSGKDGVYKEFETLISCFINDKHYVGLPANQLISVSRKYDSVVACERNKNMYSLMSMMKDNFNLSSKIVKKNIIDYLMETEEKFSIYDIDLMTYIDRNNIIEDLSNGICKTSFPLSVICLISCCGRKITDEKYNSLMPNKFINELEKRNINIIYKKSGKYIDQISPMRYELLVIKSNY